MTVQPNIPTFFIYGTPERPLDVGFFHVETIQARAEIHHGQVVPHQHSHMAQITLWTRGGGRYRIEERFWDFRAPAVSFTPPGVVHGFTVEPDADALVASVADDVMDALAPRLSLRPTEPFFLAGSAEDARWAVCADLLGSLGRECAGSGTDRHGALTAWLTLLLVELGRLKGEAALSEVETRSSRLARAFRAQVDRTFRQGLTVEEHARRLSTSRYLLDAACRGAFGKSAKQHVTDRKLLEAKRLLLYTIRSVEDIAYEIGFSDPAYFSRHFKRHVGAPPGAWRRSVLPSAAANAA